jgi:hypothetical protein
MIQEKIGQCDEVHEECAQAPKTNPHDDEEFFKGEEVANEKMEMLLKEAKTPLFEACNKSNNSHLSSVLMFFNAWIVHQVTNTFQEELFWLIGLKNFPKNNMIPKSRYQASKLVSNLNLNYKSIHACEQGCILYHRENKDLHVCLIC